MEFDEFLLRKLALGLSIAGLAGLLLITSSAQPVKTEIKDINESLLSKKVSTTGFVVWRRFNKNTLLFEIQDTEKIAVVRFNPTNQELADVTTGAIVEVKGRVERYRGKVEIVAEKVGRGGVN